MVAFINPNVYEDGKATLQRAIEEYDQAVLDLTAFIVGGNLSREIER